MTNGVNSLAGLTGLSQNPVTQLSKTAGKTALSQTDFLKLLTAQLKNQDPTAPVNNDQLVSQLAQLSTVDGINTLNTTVSGIGAKLDGNSAASAVALIGKSVLVPGDVATRQNDGSVVGAVDVPAAADKVVVTIADRNGTLLRTFDLGAQPKGLAAFRWDGTDASGASVSAATVRVAAQIVNTGRSTAAPTDVLGRVTGVDLSNAAAPSLVVDGAGSVALSAVRQVAG